MKLFTVGPVMMQDCILKEYGKQRPYFRTQEFSDIMIESEKLLKELVFTSESSRVAFLTMSGTGAMESAVISIFDQNDKVLIIDGGSFGHRFEEICQIHKIPFESIVLKYGEILTKEHLNRYKNDDFTGLLVNIDETSTGQLYDIGLISDFCQSKDMILVVDAISSFLADELKMDEMKIDALILSSQKGLSLEPGTSMVVVNDRVFRERINKNNSHTLYLDLKLHLKNQERGQTPFTPSVGTLIALNLALRNISDKGVENTIIHTRELATYFRERGRSMGLNIPTYPLSNAITPVEFDGNAFELYERLKNNYGIFVTPNGGELKDRIIRVGHLGNLNKSDYDVLFEALDEVIL